MVRGSHAYHERACTLVVERRRLDDKQLSRCRVDRHNVRRNAVSHSVARFVRGTHRGANQRTDHAVLGHCADRRAPIPPGGCNERTRHTSIVHIAPRPVRAVQCLGAVVVCLPSMRPRLLAAALVVVRQLREHRGLLDIRDFYNYLASVAQLPTDTPGIHNENADREAPLGLIVKPT